MSADQSADSIPQADSIHLFLCGDVMTGRGIDQVLPRGSRSLSTKLRIPAAEHPLEFVVQDFGPRL